MSIDQIIYSLFGGVLIGTAATLMLLFNGRVAGISGIIASSLGKLKADGYWRWMFLAGLILGGVIAYALKPDLFINTTGRSSTAILVAGLLVGYGTVMGSGCTSGHGVCGLSRLSVRSAIATLAFMLFGFLTVQAIEYFLGGSI